MSDCLQTKYTGRPLCGRKITKPDSYHAADLQSCNCPDCLREYAYDLLDKLDLAYAEIERLTIARKALESLTPGGSEFYKDPKRCVEYVHKLINSGHEAKKNLVRLRSFIK